MVQTWKQAQEWEKNWHGNCINSLNEELKQLVYAEKMGLQYSPNDKTPYSFDLQDKSIIDVGGGAYSLLLKCVNFKSSMVIDPIKPPEWALLRYAVHGITFINEPAEKSLYTADILSEDLKYDEVWIYNVLQHVKDPQKIIQNARKMSKLVRLFEWIDQPITTGHIQTFSEGDLNSWLHGEGKVEFINQNGCVGKCYFGVFPS